MKCLPVIPSLYAMGSAADVVSTLFTHGMILGREIGNKNTSQSNTALSARTSKGCMNPNCKAKKCSTHTTANCYWPGGGKEGQFPPNFGQRTKATVATSSAAPKKVEHFALSARILNTPGQSGILINDNPITHPHMALISKGFQAFKKGKVPTFMDSGASDTMFVWRDSFNNYVPLSACIGNSVKAEGGSFEIIGEGSVVQWYKVDGKEKEITYTCALHTPSLSANLISISALDKAGLITTFGNGKGIAWKPDGTVVLAGKGVNGMYCIYWNRWKPYRLCPSQ